MKLSCSIRLSWPVGAPPPAENAEASDSVVLAMACTPRTIAVGSNRQPDDGEHGHRSLDERAGSSNATAITWT